MSELENVRVRRLDGRKTRVNLEVLDYYDLDPTIVERADPWVLSEIWFNRIYMHPDFRFVAQISHVQYRGSRPSDSFMHPLAGKLMVHVRASEIPPNPVGPTSGTDETWLVPTIAARRLRSEHGDTRSENAIVVSLGREYRKFQEGKPGALRMRAGGSSNTFEVELNSLLESRRGIAKTH